MAIDECSERGGVGNPFERRASFAMDSHRSQLLLLAVMMVLGEKLRIRLQICQFQAAVARSCTCWQVALGKFHKGVLCTRQNAELNMRAGKTKL